MSQGQGQDDKNSMQILWIIAGVFLLGAFIWWAFSEYLKLAFIKIRMAELYLIWFVVKFLPLEYLESNKKEIFEALIVSKELTPGILSKALTEKLSIVVGKYLKYPIIFLLTLFCYITYHSNVKMRYKKKYNMETLAKQESSEWPQINPVLGENLVASSLDDGPWAMSITPINFCKKYKIITIQKLKTKSILDPEDKYIIKLDKVKAEKVFSIQLGRIWAGPDKMPAYKQALFAAFIARGCRDTQAARKMINQINISCANKKRNLNFAGAEALWKKHYKNFEVQEIIKAHAYEYTIFTALLLFARQDGVFASADFLWLKPYDRRLWYVLNSVGRQTPHCEAAGVYAHFLAEKALRRPLSVPMVKEAVKGLQLALDEIKYVPTSEEKEQFAKYDTG